MSIAIGVFVASTSYSRALGAPGYASVPDKTSAWARDHHLGPVVEIVENWLYGRHHPSQAAADVHQFGTAPTRPATDVSMPLPTLPIPVGATTAPAWTPGAQDGTGHPLVYTARFEPDRHYPSVVAAVAIISSTTRTHLGLGTAQLAAKDPMSLARIPAEHLPSLVAEFNSGFRFRDITGGLYFHHRSYLPLQPGQASALGRRPVGAPVHVAFSTGGRFRRQHRLHRRRSSRSIDACPRRRASGCPYRHATRHALRKLIAGPVGA
ncbi:hypothetical protein AAFP30_24445 [Gordonia sp. CPCC 205515]|uniref:hypothetical protein n=1 Tax=Gordonia sp. CPCC 205515 TaxID=3140791 RepID=UPI003AF34E99